MIYVYPIIIRKQVDQTYIANAPDLAGIVVGGDTLRDVIQAAQDACAMWLADAEKEREEIPAPTEDMKTPKNASLAFVTCDTDAYRRMNDAAPVRKTVSIPSWMAVQAGKNGISLSKTLQEALRNRLSTQ